MNKKISPLIKGLITGLALLVFALIMYFTKQTAESNLHYVNYALYAGGVFWTLFAYSRSEAYTGKFGDIFGQGFRCFVVVTLIMVSFTGIFSKMHPEFADEAAVAYKEYLLKNEKDRTPAEIEEKVELSKKQYTTGLVSTAIFGYLVMGTIFTAAGAGILLIRRQ
ncbi:MAG: DUF4199 domain-containing protein [Chitinophagaceae bacterium]|nr:MAG: DUF4199 domain-containing protein [Chitinophagaceae bacterium]